MPADYSGVSWPCNNHLQQANSTMSFEFSEKTRVTNILAPAAPGDNKRQSAFIIIIWTKVPLLLGKKYTLDTDPYFIGRDEKNNITLDNNTSISRMHAHITQREEQWFLIDTSMNGTLVNGARVSREVNLKDGDKIQIGPCILKFWGDVDIEARYHEEIYQMTICDGLTQAYNNRYLLESLDRGIKRRDKREMYLLLFSVDRMKRINEVYGETTGDCVLQEVVKRAQPLLQNDDVLARYTTDTFAAIMTGVVHEEAIAVAERICRRVSSSKFDVNEESLNVTVTMGVAKLRDDVGTGTELVHHADFARWVAKSMGRNRVCSYENVAQFQRTIDGMSLLEIALTKTAPQLIVAFAVDGEPTISRQLGSHVYEEWFQELVLDVGLRISRVDMLGTWQGRYVLAALQDGSPESTARLFSDVRSTWEARSVPAIDAKVSRLVRSAILTSSELVDYGERSLDVLISRLQRTTSKSSTDNELPFPIAALRAAVSTRRTPLGRVIALLDGIETSLRFAYSIALAIVRDNSGLHAPAAEFIRQSYATSSGWEIGAPRLAAVVSNESRGELAEALQSLAFGENGGSSAFMDALRYALAVRREILTRRDLPEDAFGKAEYPLRILLDYIIDSLRPISFLQLVSVAEIESIGEDGDDIRYGLYIHKGPGVDFPIIRETLPYRLQKCCCYLLSEDRNRPPICLSPIVLSRTCQECGRVEVALSEELVFGPKGAQVAVRGVSTGHAGSIELPWLRRMEELYVVVRSIRANPSIVRTAQSEALDASSETTVIVKNVSALMNQRGNVQKAPSVEQTKIMVGDHRSLPQAVRERLSHVQTVASRPVTVLFLAANPSDKTKLSLDREVRAITHRLRASKHGGAFRIEHEWAATIDDLQACLLRHVPDIVHFSGHGNPAGMILLNDESGRAVPVSPRALSHLFKILRGDRPIRCVVLNACYSANQAEGIAENVDCVVAMSGAVQEESSICFSGAFYQALGFGKNVRIAFELGCNEVDLKSLCDADVPLLISGKGKAPETMCFV